ncbi:MAG TPA: hypothetical protein VL172_04500, partial [Kofleriaceae bacterium]|nr:hypothetical protein [Kofleriaceae bacterium]
MDSDDPGRRRLGFTFRLAGGTGKLVLEDARFFGWLGVERLELEVPGLELPVDLTAGPERFQRRRTRVRIAALRLEQRDIDRLVAARAAAAAEVGIDRVQVRVREGFLAVAARAREGAHAADLTARIHLIAGSGPDLRLVVTDAHTYGFLPLPAPLAAHRLLMALTAAPSGRGEAGREQARVCGLGDVELSPLGAFLWHTLPASGWRLPDGSGAELVAARPGRGAVHITYGPGPTPRAAAGDGEAAAALL